MIGKNKVVDHGPVQEKISTLIGAGTVFNGDFIVQDTMRVDGTINGNCTSKGTLILGEEGKIVGKCKADRTGIGNDLHQFGIIGRIGDSCLQRAFKVYGEHMVVVVALECFNDNSGTFRFFANKGPGHCPKHIGTAVDVIFLIFIQLGSGKETVSDFAETIVIIGVADLRVRDHGFVFLEQFDAEFADLQVIPIIEQSIHNIA